jgi:signal transduction histidine kinase
LNRHQELAEGRLSHSEDLPFLRKDGSIVYVDIISDRITYNGRPCLIHLLRDTTERRQAQKALKKEHRALKHLLQSSDHERQLIAYEIHDGLAQQLAGAIMQLETFSYQRDNQPKEAAKAYDAAITMLRQAHFETRRLISGVRPPILDESGIVAAVAHLVNEHRLQNGPIIEFRGDVSFDRLVPILENAIYRIVQEGLANTCKHSKSPKVRVELVQHEDVLRIKVEDWGIGFDPANVKEDRFGLEGIRERARLLGGSTTVKSTPRQGTCLTVELPLVFREK